MSYIGISPAAAAKPGTASRTLADNPHPDRRRHRASKKASRLSVRNCRNAALRLFVSSAPMHRPCWVVLPLLASMAFLCPFPDSPRPRCICQVQQIE